MSPGMWYELNLARLREIQIADAMQARITNMIASSIPTKQRKTHKEENFRFFPIKKAKPMSLLDKFKKIVETVNSVMK